MTDYERIEKVIKYIDAHYQEQPSLATLARVANLSESHFQKLFSRWTGVSPKSFLQFLTAQKAKQLLLASKDVLTASLESGLSGPGRLHDLMISIEAMSPGEFKTKGKGIEILYGTHATPFGSCLIGLTPRGICHMAFFDADKDRAIAEMKERWAGATFRPSQVKTAPVIRELFKKTGKRRFSLLLRGTPFQIKVWEALLSIPEGEVVSYNHLAKLAGSPKASRAVGSAVGSNTIAYLIPCHRVIRETGFLGQYRWGESRKKTILHWELTRKEKL